MVGGSQHHIMFGVRVTLSMLINDRNGGASVMTNVFTEWLAIMRLFVLRGRLMNVRYGLCGLAFVCMCSGW